MSQDGKEISSLSTMLESLEKQVPDLLNHTQDAARQGLHELQGILPKLKRMVQDGTQAEGTLKRRVKALRQAESILEQVQISTENAVTEVFGEVEAIHSRLDKCAELCRGQSLVVDILLDIKERQMHILGALQFQDIVSQQTRAVQSLLEKIERDLEGTASKDDNTISVGVSDGTFDPEASFDRDQAEADQSDIDKWIEDSGSGDKQ